MNLSFVAALFATALLLKPQSKEGESRPAPEFPKVSAERWLNSPPLKMSELRGKVILLDVWTFM